MQNKGEEKTRINLYSGQSLTIDPTTFQNEEEDNQDRGGLYQESQRQVLEQSAFTPFPWHTFGVVDNLRLV